MANAVNHYTNTDPVKSGGSGEGHSAATVFFRWLGRLAIMMVILFLVSVFTPGFSIAGLWSFLIAAVVICLLDYLLESVMKVDASPFGKGLKGFLLSAIILYATQFVVPNMQVTILGAILGALAIGILDAVFPTKVM